MKHTFEKKERLNRKSLIQRIFSGGHTFHVPPFRVTWLAAGEMAPAPFQVMISVPKSHIRLAVDRNLIRRRIREAYRLNKMILGEAGGKSETPAAFCITYTSREILSFSAIQGKIILILQRLIKENEKVTR